MFIPDKFIKVETHTCMIVCLQWHHLRARDAYIHYSMMFHWEPEGCFCRGIFTIQWCSIENQKGAFAEAYSLFNDVPLRTRRVLLQRHIHYSMMFHWEPEGCFCRGIFTIQWCSIENQKGAFAEAYSLFNDVPLRTRRVLLQRHIHYSMMFHWESEGRFCRGIFTIQWCSIENQKGAFAVQSLWQ